MDFIVRGSEYQDFLTCRKKWAYSWVEGIEQKKPNEKLFFGTLFHKWLEILYSNEFNPILADMQASIWMNEQDLSAMDQTEIDELKTLFKGVRDYYVKTYVSDKIWNILGTEMEFLVKLDDNMFYTGTIDLVYEVDGKIRFMDHKTVSNIAMYEEKAIMDRQISRYWWALKQIAAGIGRVKNADGIWVQWPELIGKEIDGFTYNIIKKDYPRPPKQLKSGALSQDKNQKTTYDLYLNSINYHKFNVAEYMSMLNFLKDKPNQFLKRIDVNRTEQELEESIWDFLYTCGDMHDVTLAMMQNLSAMEQLTYRNIGTHCHTFCQFKSLCKTAIEGGNVDLVKQLEYKKREVGEDVVENDED